jgi:hypothetical protein
MRSASTRTRSAVATSVLWASVGVDERTHTPLDEALWVVEGPDPLAQAVGEDQGVAVEGELGLEHVFSIQPT